MSDDPPADPRVGTPVRPSQMRALPGRGALGDVCATGVAKHDRRVALEAWIEANESLLPSGRCAG